MAWWAKRIRGTVTDLAFVDTVLTVQITSITGVVEASDRQNRTTSPALSKWGGGIVNICQHPT